MQKFLSKPTNWIKKTWNFLERENIIRPLFIIIFLVIVISPIVWGIESLQKQPDDSSITDIKDSFWWTIVTLTTVGYGDFYPKTIPGRFIALFIMIVGIGVLSVLNGLVARILLEKKLRKELGMESYKVENHIIICEWNYRSKVIIQELRKHSKTKKIPIVLIADIERKPTYGENLFFVKGAVNDETLRKAELKKAKTVIILGDDKLDYTSRDAKVILSTLTVESINRDAYTIVELLNESYTATCKRAHADEIILSSNLNCNLIVSAAINHGISHVVSDILNYGDGSQLYKIPATNQEVGKPFIDVFISTKKEKQSIVIAIQQGKEGKVISNPPSNHQLAEDDYLIIIADSNESQFSET